MFACRVVVAAGRVVVAAGRVVVAPHRIVVACGRVVVACGRVVVACGRVVVTPGRVVVTPDTTDQQRAAGHVGAGDERQAEEQREGSKEELNGLHGAIVPATSFAGAAGRGPSEH